MGHWEKWGRPNQARTSDAFGRWGVTLSSSPGEKALGWEEWGSGCRQTHNKNQVEGPNGGKVNKKARVGGAGGKTGRCNAQ